VEQAAGTAPSTEHELLARERWQQVLNAVATLPDRQRLVFTLSHLDERTAAEISESTGMSPATVRVHLFRAIRKLRATLGEHA
jgi:RNA polymerase sigma-70 factor (ECF subfamily)